MDVEAFEPSSAAAAALVQMMQNFRAVYWALTYLNANSAAAVLCQFSTSLKPIERRRATLSIC